MEGNLNDIIVVDTDPGANPSGAVQVFPTVIVRGDGSTITNY